MTIHTKPTVVSICSDFGTNDYRASALKARILSNNHSIELVDISHQISPFDLVEAAFVCTNAFLFFPAGSIHVVWVFNAGFDRGILLAQFQNHYFIVPDNGLLGLLVGLDQPEKIYRISDDSYEFRDRIASAIKVIIESQDGELMYDECENPIIRFNVSPVYQKDRIQARVASVDHYGNLILNIRQKPFEEVAMQKKFSFQTSSQQKVSDFYLGETNAENGSFYSYFNHAGYMILALCGGHAANTLDLKREDILQIVFE
ncbi:MAG: SAM-dependent chlorinase/fluorinase [Saprospiraceae bacterium]|nr:SAM-dependent chlorinase/fluorinase [Saprospiraceae bacterium]